MVGFEKFLGKRGSFFSRGTFWVPIPLLSSEMQFLPISPVKVVRFDKCQHKNGSFFLGKCFVYPQSYVIFKNAVFGPISPLQVIEFEKNSKTKVGSFFYKTNILSTHMLCYLDKCSFYPHISSLSSWIWKFLTRTAFFKTPGTPIDPLRQTDGQLIRVKGSLYEEPITGGSHLNHTTIKPNSHLALNFCQIFFFLFPCII